MSTLPMWSALTEKESMRKASGTAKAAMFAAGETSTSICSLAAAAAYAAHAAVPGGHTLLVATILWTIASTITVAVVPKGDYTKALRALGWRRTPGQATDKPAGPSRQRSWGALRRPPVGNELRNAVAGWSLANIALVGLWLVAGAGSRGSST